jgi:hypothetical protein
VNRGRDVAQERHRVVVSTVERDPGERAGVSLRPARVKGRLAERGAAMTVANGLLAVRSRPPSSPSRARTTVGELDVHKIERNFGDGRSGTHFTPSVEEANAISHTDGMKRHSDAHVNTRRR